MATYEININMKSDGGQVEGEKDKTKVPSKDDKSPGSVTNSVMMYVASKTVQPFIQQTVSSISSQISMVSGKKSVSEKINFGMNIASQAMGVVSTATAGFAMGKTLGIGGGAGVGLGLTIMAVMKGVEFAFSSAELSTKHRMQNLQSAMISGRAGTNVNASREGI